VRQAAAVSQAAGWRNRLFLVLVAVLPVHTVFLSAWISWKPFLAALAVLAAADLAEGARAGRWPWHRPGSAGLAVLLAVVAIGFPEAAYRERFLRLGLALVVGGLVMLVTERRLRSGMSLDRLLGVVFWSAAVMGVTAVVFSLVAVGAFGSGAIRALDGPPPGVEPNGLYRVFKPAYLTSGFLALTNWHQDPGYGAAWTNLWAVLTFAASARGRGSGRWWPDGMVLGGLGFAVTMAFSRTGWLAFPIALTVAALVHVLRRLIRLGEVLRLLGAAVLAGAVLLAGVWSADVEGVGGDLDLQFAFRLQQGWDLFADLTGLFATSEAFEDRFDVSEERADVWPEYVAMFRAHPVLGVGLGVGWLTNSIRQEPHNLALELLAETGLLGLGAFCLLLGVILRSGGGVVGGVALLTAFLPAMTQTVLFEPAWWFAAALYLAGANVRSNILGVEPAHA
jgi:hypothetical protein